MSSKESMFRSMFSPGITAGTEQDVEEATSTKVSIPVGFNVGLFISKKKKINSTWKIETLESHWFFFYNKLQKKPTPALWNNSAQVLY